MKKRPLSLQLSWSNFQVSLCYWHLGQKDLSVALTYISQISSTMPPPIPYCFPVIQPDTHALKLSLPVTPKETIFLPPAEVFFSIIIDNIQVSLFLSLGIILGQI